MTERELAQARLLKLEAERLRLLLEAELEPSCCRLIAEHLERIESRRFELLAWIISIPDDKVRLICIMRFLEGKSWETIARRLHYERTSPAKMMRRFLTRHAEGCTHRK